MDLAAQKTRRQMYLSFNIYFRIMQYVYALLFIIHTHSSCGKTFQSTAVEEKSVIVLKTNKESTGNEGDESHKASIKCVFL